MLDQKEDITNETIMACLSQVMIADERIWERGQKVKEEYKAGERIFKEKDFKMNPIPHKLVGNKFENIKMKYFDVFKWMGVNLIKISNRKIDYNNMMSIYEESKKLSGENGIMFLIIHLGLLGKMKEEDENNYKSFIQFLKYENRKLRFNFVLTSGRGNPSLPDELKNSRYIEISNIETCLDNGDKLGLYQMLCSLRGVVND